MRFRAYWPAVTACAVIAAACGSRTELTGAGIEQNDAGPPGCHVLSAYGFPCTYVWYEGLECGTPYPENGPCPSLGLVGCCAIADSVDGEPATLAHCYYDDDAPAAASAKAACISTEREFPRSEKWQTTSPSGATNF